MPKYPTCPTQGCTGQVQSGLGLGDTLATAFRWLSGGGGINTAGRVMKAGASGQNAQWNYGHCNTCRTNCVYCGVCSEDWHPNPVPVPGDSLTCPMCNLVLV